MLSFRVVWQLVLFLKKKTVWLKLMKLFFFTWQNSYLTSKHLTWLIIKLSLFLMNIVTWGEVPSFMLILSKRSLHFLILKSLTLWLPSYTNWKSSISAQRLYSWMVWLKATTMPLKHPIFSSLLLLTRRWSRIPFDMLMHSRCWIVVREARPLPWRVSHCLMAATETICLALRGRDSVLCCCEQTVWGAPASRFRGQSSITSLHCLSPQLNWPLDRPPSFLTSVLFSDKFPPPRIACFASAVSKRWFHFKI